MPRVSSSQTFCNKREYMKKLLLLASLFAIGVNAQQCQITEFKTTDGTITWTNPDTNFYYGIEYTSDLLKGHWEHPNESLWWNIQSTDPEISTQIPMSVINDESVMFFRIVSSPSPMPIVYVDLNISYWPSSTDKWWLQVHRVLTDDASRVYVTGEYISGEYDLSLYGIENDQQRWTSYDTGNYNLGGEPIFPTDFLIHVVTTAGTNTVIETVTDYETH